MKGLSTETYQEKHLFKSIYCLDCKQAKSCGKLNSEYCCWCSYQNQRESWTNYLTYEKALTCEKQQRKEHKKNLHKLAKGKTIKNRIDFMDWKKFYQQKGWEIDLEEWLKNKRTLPIDSQCAKQWRKDKEHLPEKCNCLDRKAWELHEYFTNCLQEDKKKLKKECFCEVNPKVRTPYIDSRGESWIYCEICDKRIEGAGHHGVIKNRNDPKFWGLEVEEKVLCGDCLGKLVEEMPKRKKYLFWEYRKRRYW